MTSSLIFRALTTVGTLMVTTNCCRMGLPSTVALMGTCAQILHAFAAIMTFFISYSRKILWLEVSPTNKDSKVIAGYYLQAVEKYGEVTTTLLICYDDNDYYHVGCPKIVRADKGTENAKVSFLHPFLRYQSTDGIDDSAESAFRYGRSVNNQVGYFVLHTIHDRENLANRNHL